MSETIYINRERVRELVYSLGGCIMRVNYISRQTGETKTGLYTTNLKKSGNGGPLKYDPVAKRLIIVTEVVSLKQAQKHSRSPFRSLAEDCIVSIQAQG